MVHLRWDLFNEKFSFPQTVHEFEKFINFLRAVNKNMLVVMKWIKIGVIVRMNLKSNINAIPSIEQIQFAVVAVRRPNAMKMQNFASNHLSVLTQRLLTVVSFVKIVAI